MGVGCGAEAFKAGIIGVAQLINKTAGGVLSREGLVLCQSSTHGKPCEPREPNTP